jgi:hypothetical protein
MTMFSSYCLRWIKLENYFWNVNLVKLKKKMCKVWLPKFDLWLGAGYLTFSDRWNVTAECDLITCMAVWWLPVSYRPALHFYLNYADEIHMGISYGSCAMVCSLVATLHFTTTGSTASPWDTLSDKPQQSTHGFGLFQNVAINHLASLEK